MELQSVMIRDKKLEPLIPILGEWIGNMKSYEKAENRPEMPDMPFDYGERANVGFLNGAFWKSGHVTLAEYRENTRTGVRHPDLYANVGRTGFIMEFKNDDPYSIHGQVLENTAKRILIEEAESAFTATEEFLDNLNGHLDKVHFIGGLFVALKSDGCDWKSEGRMCLIDKIDWLESQDFIHALAYWFPVREVVASVPNGEELADYPLGIALLLHLKEDTNQSS
jgi:hypothetical protein